MVSETLEFPPFHDLAGIVIPNDKKYTTFPWGFTPAKELKKIITSFALTSL